MKQRIPIKTDILFWSVVTDALFERYDIYNIDHIEPHIYPEMPFTVFIWIDNTI